MTAQSVSKSSPVVNAQALATHAPEFDAAKVEQLRRLEAVLRAHSRQAVEAGDPERSLRLEMAAHRAFMLRSAILCEDASQYNQALNLAAHWPF